MNQLQILTVSFIMTLVGWCNFGISQESSEAKQSDQFTQYRSQIGIYGYSVLDQPINSLNIGGVGGLQFNVGSNWYLNSGYFRPVIKVMWFRVGFHMGDMPEDGGLLFSPLNLGLGHQFRIKGQFSVTPAVSFAAFGFTRDIVSDWDYRYGMVSELAINFNDASLELEYDQRPYLGSEKMNTSIDAEKTAGISHYISVGFRANVGPITKKK
jgi:hypothetical protein